MEWSKIKSIFIVIFLLLNLYLMYELKKIYQSSQYDYISEVSLENKLKTEEIEYSELPKNIKSGKYISATPRHFTEEDFEKLKDTILLGQTVTIKNYTTIESILEKPLSIKKDQDYVELGLFLKNNVLYGDQYRFWEVNELNNTITYYQQLDERIFYKNISGEIIFYLNESGEVISYKQTLLENFEELSEDESILQPFEAIETLYNNGELPFGSKITKVELGYYTYVHLTSSQVLTPVWRFVVDDNRDLYVNAIEGKIIQLNNNEKIIVE